MTRPRSPPLGPDAALRGFAQGGRASLACLAVGGLALSFGCSRSRADPGVTATPPATAPQSPAATAWPSTRPPPPLDATLAPAEAGAADAASDAGGARVVGGGDAGEPGPASDAAPLHKTTAEDLLGLFAIRSMSPQEEARIRAQPFLRHVVGPGSPRTMSQGNPDLALHTISRAACLAGLAGVTLQTPEQRAICGHENMVPIHLKGKAPYYCVDIFEFPNKACELPFVWTSPTYAKKVCELQGKRLCSQIEWQLACRADPAEGPDTRYAYGDKLDLSVCHTSRRHRQVADKPCTLTDAQTAWRTCSTDTEPAGSFPQCRSRYGVYDQHGNVAEIMMRRDEGGVKTQLKGSAWFYDEVAREVGSPPLHAESRGAYPDHCDFDPRWHVEPIDNAWHVNYHLGFRCCKSVP